MEGFKLFNGDSIENLADYLKEYYAQYPDLEVFVGTDSAQHGKVTKYATAISLLRPGKGVHVIYRKISINRERDMFTRLWNEVEHTREVGEYVNDVFQEFYDHNIDGKIPTLHLDFNKQPKYKSYVVHDLSVGYLTAFGFKVKTKPESWCATFCADNLVKN
jgi:predicted RNase H-related nuclease YkuK (DUF458 family)